MITCCQEAKDSSLSEEKGTKLKLYLSPFSNFNLCPKLQQKNAPSNKTMISLTERFSMLQILIMKLTTQNEQQLPPVSNPHRLKVLLKLYLVSAVKVRTLFR